MKYKSLLPLTLGMVRKIKKMVFLLAPSIDSPGEEVIAGETTQEIQDKHEWILRRFFQEDLSEIYEALRKSSSATIYFFVAEKRWKEKDSHVTGRVFEIERIKVGYRVHKIITSNGAKKETITVAELPWEKWETKGNSNITPS